MKSHRGKPSVRHNTTDLYADRQGGTTVAPKLQYGVREGGDGDEVTVDSEVLFQFLDEQSRSLRDFLRIAREG